MRRMTLILSLLAITYNGITAPLSLHDCYQAALDYNAQRKLLSERLHENTARINEVSGQRLPSVTLLGSATHNGDVEKVNLGSSTFSMMPDNSYRT